MTTSRAKPELPVDPALAAPERERWIAQLRQLAAAREVGPADWLRGQPQLLSILAPPASFPGGLPWSGWFFSCREDELLLAALDLKLGTPDSVRQWGPLLLFGPPQRQLRALLGKHGIAGYDDRRLNAFELLERLAGTLR